MKLYCVQLKVRPATTHPIFHNWSYGLFLAAFYADHPLDAVNRASVIAGQLPYKLETGRLPKISLLKAHESDLVYKQLRKLALNSGLAVDLLPYGLEKPADWEQ